MMTMANKVALIVWGGWDGHQPKQVAEIFERVLKEDGFTVEVSDTLDSLAGVESIENLSLIVPVWTMGKLPDASGKPVFKVVRENGVGIAGCHGGMGDAFREHCEWQFMTGGQFVSHPGNNGTNYRVKVLRTGNPITEGIADFDVSSEQYYMHVDPAIKVLATTEFPVADGPHVPNGRVDMPVVWTKYYGKGKVFYNSLGHDAKLVESEPCLTLMRRGFRWAAK
jgi:type 1 glutamine amidotransferase